MYLSTVILVMAGCSAVTCFFPNRLTEFDVTKETYTHEDITELGILKAVAAYFEDYPRPGESISPGDLTGMEDISAQKLFTAYYGANLTGSSLQNVISDIVKANNDIYLNHFFSEADWHFSGETIKKAHLKMSQLRETVITLLTGEVDHFVYARELIGIYLHMLQMFYSNTNWVEMFGSDAYYKLGILGETLYPQAPAEMMTCRSCGQWYPSEPSCNETLIFDSIVLTSGYMSRQDVEKPARDKDIFTTGKCSHGGPSDATGATIAALGGINKDTVVPELSPHYFLHNLAAQAAINHTCYFLNDKDNGLRSIIGEKKYSRLFQLKTGESLVLTLDYSGSMRDDVDAVKEQVAKIITDLQGTIHEPSDYIIVLFNDPVDLHKQFQTNNSQEALAYIQAINVNGGGDCPEYAMTGIETAIGLSQPNSRMYIFTDASAKDYEKKSLVENLATQKGIELIFFLTGDCGTRRRRDANGNGQWIEEHSRSKRSVNGADLYKSLASATGGAVYVTDKAGISELANIIAESATTTSVTIFKREVDADVIFNVDKTVDELIITITGTSKPNEEIYNELGNRETTGLATTDLDNGKLIKIAGPNPGEWRISGLGSATWLVDVSAISTLDISTIFVQNDPSTGFEYQIKGRPVAGENATVIVTVPSGNLITSLDFVNLLSSGGLPLQKLEDITVIEGRGDTKLYRVQFELPTQEFHVSVDGKDTDGNVFTRLQSQKIAPVAIQLDLLPVNGTLYVNETLTLEYLVINKAATQAEITVTVEDDRGFVQEPRTTVLTLDPEQNATQPFNVAAGSTSNVITTITVTAKITGGSNSQFVVTRLSTNERSTRAVDDITPVCNITSMTGICDEKMVDPCVCSQYNWTGSAEIWDEGFGLYQITSSVKADGTFSFEPFEQGFKLENGTIMANISGSCCNPNAYITVVDEASNTGQCSFDLAPDVENIPTECIQDLIDPVCNITSMTGMCDEMMVDPCVCSQYNWTGTAEIWDEGFGLQEIFSSLESLMYDPFTQGYTTVNGTILANISGNCCNYTAFINVTDLANNTDQCSFNLAPDVENIPTECIQDLVDPVCNITSMTGICDETMVDPCVCSQYNWTGTAEISDDGFGLQEIISSLDNTEGFVYDTFAQGYSRVNGTVTATISGNCCNYTAFINVTDMANNTDQCSFNLAPDVENIPTECIQDLIDPVCNITSMTGICDETMVDPCVCSQYNWTATAEIWDEGFGLQEILSSIDNTEGFVYDSFAQGYSLMNGTIIANISGNCCNYTAFINVTDLANNTDQCSFNLAPDVENFPTECIQDLIDPVCNITSMTGICDATMVDPCVCSQYNWTATAEIWDEGFGLQEILSSIDNTEGFVFDSFAQGYSRVNGTIIANISGSCCNYTAFINVTDMANNTDQCSFNLAPDVENIPTECIQDLIDPVCNITSMTGICNVTMVDPCVCEDYKWAVTSEVWDEGFGISQISTSVRDKARFAHSVFQKGHTIVNGTLIAKVEGNCCDIKANITVFDLANNTGQCELNLAPAVEVFSSECEQSETNEDGSTDKSQQEVTITAMAVGGGVAAAVVIGLIIAIVVIIMKSMAAKKPEVLIPEKRSFSRPLKHNSISYSYSDDYRWF